MDTATIDSRTDALADTLRRLTSAKESLKAQITELTEQFTGLPAMEADLLDAIDALTGADAWETQIKARKDRLVVEYIPDRDEMIACLAALPDPVE